MTHRNSLGRKWFAACLAGCMVSALPAGAADLEAATATGERVVLHEDFTWEYAAPEGDETPSATETITAPETPALLEVTARKSVAHGCRFGFTLTNRLPDRIKSIVPQFLAFKDAGVMYQRKFQAFSDIRPTMQQYKEVQFDGISCDDIEHLEITGAGRCEVGELSKFSAGDAQCLAQFEIVENPLIRVVKAAAPE